MVNWKLADPVKLRQQLKRGWPDLIIQDVLDNPALTLPAKDLRYRGTSLEDATVYYRKDGYYILHNNTTEEIIQLSDRFDQDWYDEHRGQIVGPIP